jgi:hypothetical protein
MDYAKRVKVLTAEGIMVKMDKRKPTIVYN